MERTGVLVMRAWLEDASETVCGSESRKRSTFPGEIVILAATSDEVYVAVRAWLEAFTAG